LAYDFEVGFSGLTTYYIFEMSSNGGFEKYAVSLV